MKNDQICPICKKEKHPYFPLCLECLPYNYKKSTFPHQKARKSKEWIENRSRLIEKVNYRCRWCDTSKEDNPKELSIHHPWGINASTYEYIWDGIVTKKYKDLGKNDPILQDLFNLRKNYEEKKKLKQRLKQVEEKNYQNKIEEIKTKLKSNKFRMTEFSRNKILSSIYPYIYNDALDTYHNEVEQLVSEYVGMYDAIVLCKKCHSAARLGYKLCKKCKVNYHKKEFGTCYQCFKKLGKTNEELWDDDWEDESETSD